MSAAAAGPTGAPAPLNTEALRKDFPLLSRKVNGRPIVYLDAAASALQPQSVISAMTNYYETTHSNVHEACTPPPRRRPQSTSGRASSPAVSWVRPNRRARSSSPRTPPSR